MKHKHYDIIVAWAADTTQVVETRYPGQQGWYEDRSRQWRNANEYRIKPQPKPDVVAVGIIACTDSKIPDYKTTFRVSEHYERDNLRLTFDGETGNLKSAEVLS